MYSWNIVNTFRLPCMRCSFYVIIYIAAWNATTYWQNVAKNLFSISFTIPTTICCLNGARSSSKWRRGTPFPLFQKFSSVVFGVDAQNKLALTAYSQWGVVCSLLLHICIVFISKSAMLCSNVITSFDYDAYTQKHGDELVRSSLKSMEFVI